MAKIKATKTSKMLNALTKGSEISVKQAISRFGLESPNAVTSVVRNLRDRGVDIETVKVKGVQRYRLASE